MSKPKISVLMAVYNENPTYLKRAIQSILNQTFSNFEFIIIDDNSNKQTHSALKSYTKKDVRITLIKNKKNLGLTKSLNIGIKKSQGKYIARMDSDDISRPERLVQQLNFLLTNNYDLVTCDYCVINDKAQILKKKRVKTTDKIKKQLLKGNIFVHSTFFGKRKVFKELYNENFKQAQDYEFILRILSKNYRIGNLPKICLKYRVNENGISFKNSKKQEWSAIKIRFLAIKKYGYKKIYIIYLLRSLVTFLLPHKFKRFLLK